MVREGVELAAVLISSLLKIALVAFFAWLVWSVFRPRYTLRIVVDKDGVHSATGLSAAQKQKVLGFLENDIELENRITILGARRRDGGMCFTLRGRLHPSIRQQIRNFLLLNV